MKRRCALVLMTMLYSVMSQARGQRILFVNEAPESVLVSIGYDKRVPVERSIVERGERKYFFPPYISFTYPYHIVLEGMFSQTDYALRLTGDLQRSLVRACRSYGELQLLRGDLIVASIGAGAIDKGIVLTYTDDYSLILGLYKKEVRPRVRKKRCSPGCLRSGARRCRVGSKA